MRLSILKVLVILTILIFVVANLVILIEKRHQERGVYECQQLKR